MNSSLFSLSLDEFEQELRRLGQQHFPGASVDASSRRLNRLSLRIHLSVQLFIDIYYHPQSHRLDFSTIYQEQRIFGYDNAGGWHYHPAGQPDHHEPCPEPTLEKIFAETAQVIRALSIG